ncbi:MAG: hypothetical protein D6E12_14825 [Desulfovibrio sp.]|nr:MAG: hypothetical protein D6E12_14825 [Desulfovibrio sp.]
MSPDNIVPAPPGPGVSPPPSAIVAAPAGPGASPPPDGITPAPAGQVFIEGGGHILIEPGSGRGLIFHAYV